MTPVLGLDIGGANLKVAHTDGSARSRPFALWKRPHDDAVAAAVPPEAVRVWRTDGRFVNLDDARADPRPAAAANWLALATFAGRCAPDGSALLVDIGSTTADLIPLRDGRPVPSARTDPERLKSGELVYTGVRRTPACA